MISNSIKHTLQKKNLIKLYTNSTSESWNDCSFPHDLLYFRWTFYASLAEGGQTDHISSRWSNAWSRGNIIRLDRTFVHEYFILRSIELCDEILLFSRFLRLASEAKKSLQRVDWLLSSSCPVFRPKPKILSGIHFSFQNCSTAGPGGYKYRFQSFWEKCHATHRRLFDSRWKPLFSAHTYSNGSSQSS